MAVTQSGSAAGGAVHARRRPVPVIPQPVIPQPTDPERLLEAVRRGLVPVDPVAQLLAALVPAGRSRPAGTATG